MCARVCLFLSFFLLLLLRTRWWLCTMVGTRALAGNMYFWQSCLQVIDIRHAKTCTKIKCTSIDTQNFRFWHVVWLVKEKTTRQLTLYKLKWHVLLGIWHWGDILEENEDDNWHSFLFLKTSRDTLDLKLNVKWNLSNIHTASRPSHDSIMGRKGGRVFILIPTYNCSIREHSPRHPPHYQMPITLVDEVESQLHQPLPIA